MNTTSLIQKLMVTTGISVHMIFLLTSSKCISCGLEKSHLAWGGGATTCNDWFPLPLLPLLCDLAFLLPSSSSPCNTLLHCHDLSILHPSPSHFIYLSTSIRLSLAPQTDGLVGGAICDKRVRNLPTGCPTITSKCIIYKLHGLLFGIEYSCSLFYKTTLFIFK